MTHFVYKIPAKKPITWEHIEKLYGLTGLPYKIPLSFTDEKDDFAKMVQMNHRTYIYNDEVWKFRIGKGHERFVRLATPYEEAGYLKMLENVPHVARFKRYIEHTDHTILVTEYFKNIGTLRTINIPPQFEDKVEMQKHAVIQAVNKAGILHNDLGDFNFLVSPGYDLCLIDFDNAEPANGRNDYEHSQYYRVKPPKNIPLHMVPEIHPVFQVECPDCRLELEIPRRGRWKCPGCDNEFIC